MLGRRMTVVAALFAGAIFGSASTGCFAVWLGVARADGASGTLVTVQCGSDGWAVLDQPGRDKYDLAANVSIVNHAPTSVKGPGGAAYYSPQSLLTSGVSVTDGSAASGCVHGQSVEFYVR